MHDKMFTVSTPEIKNEVLEQALEFMKERNAHLDYLDSYYTGRHRILKRQAAHDINNQLVINHAKYITDISTGFLLGSPVEYQFYDESYDPSPVLDAFRMETIADKDESFKFLTGRMGQAFMHLYATENSIPRTAIIDPRYALVAYDDSVEHKPLWALVIEDIDNVLRKKGQSAPSRFFLYTDKEIIEYSYPDLTVKGAPQPHYWNAVPIIEGYNNRDKTADFESVVSLIDAYNLLQSDRVNDVEQLVQAFLFIKGMDLTPEQMAKLNLNRVMSNVDPSVDIEYVTKALNGADVETLRGVISEDIHKISMTPNLTDKEFVGNSSGVAIQYKLVAFEMATKNKERALESILKKRFSMYSKYLAKKSVGSEIEEFDIDVVFKRALPQNDYEKAQMINLLKDTLSDQTLITQLSFTKEAEEEIELKKQQDLDLERLSSNSFGQLPDEDTEGLE